MAAIAAQAAGAVVSAMATTAFGAVSRKVGRALGGSDPEQEESLVTRLERDRQRVESVDQVARGAVEGVLVDAWTDTLVGYLRRNPEEVSSLRALLAEIGQEVKSAPSVTSIVQTATASGKGSRINQVGGSQHNHGPGSAQ